MTGDSSSHAIKCEICGLFDAAVVKAIHIRKCNRTKEILPSQLYICKSCRNDDEQFEHDFQKKRKRK